MSKSLVKLIDYSLLPAALIIVGKFAGLFLTIRIFSLEWGIESVPNTFFSVRPVFYSADIKLASSYSDLILFLVVMMGFSLVLIQAVVFHNSHISPNILSRLANHNLLGLVKSTFEIYHKAAIWTIFLWMTNMMIFLNVALGKTYLWVVVFSVLVSVFLTVFLIRDVSQEIEISKKSSGTLKF